MNSEIFHQVVREKFHTKVVEVFQGLHNKFGKVLSGRETDEDVWREIKQSHIETSKVQPLAPTPTS
jgi:hypothetical protein